jgi:hypothetical protein
MEPDRAKRDQCQADDAKQKMCGGTPELMGQRFSGRIRDCPDHGLVTRD